MPALFRKDGLVGEGCLEGEAGDFERESFLRGDGYGVCRLDDLPDVPRELSWWSR